MFSYYLELALRSLRRSPGLTLLMVLTIGFGVAASMTSWSVFRAVSGDPIPWKSSKLFVPQIDNWGPKGRSSDGEPPNAMDYADAIALMRDHRAKRQSAMYQISPSIVPAQADKHPFNVSGHVVYGEFFPMLDVPFKYGSGWSADDDTNRAMVAVISSKLNQKLFGGASSVGKTVNIEGKDYRVVGVLDDWNPQPRFYDVVNTGGFSTTGDDVFLPFLTAIQEAMSNDGNTNCNEVPKESGFVGLQHSECVWIAYMAELDDVAAATSYRNYLNDYARAQQQAGRFGWAPNSRLRDLPGILANDRFSGALIANTVVALILFRFRQGDSNMRSVWICSRNDAIGNIAVVAAAAGVFGTGTGYPDLLVAVIMAVLGISGGWQIIRQARTELGSYAPSSLRT